MYTNVAYLGEQDEDIVDLCSPLYKFSRPDRNYLYHAIHGHASY